jgi:hypothetical protein
VGQAAQRDCSGIRGGTVDFGLVCCVKSALTMNEDSQNGAVLFNDKGQGAGDNRWSVISLLQKRLLYSLLLNGGTK